MAAMKYRNYTDFIKREIKGIPVGMAQPQLGLGAVLVRDRSGDFTRAGTLGGLCASTESQQQIQRDLANVENLDQHPFGRQTTQHTVQGIWSCKASGFLGVVVPNAGSLSAWMDSKGSLKFTAYDVTTEYLKDDYLLDIINNGKWKPNVDTLRDLYIIQEVVLVSRVIVMHLKGWKGGVGARLAPEIPLNHDVGANISLDEDGSLHILGALDKDGHHKPFAIAVRTAHVLYDKEMKLKKPMELGVRRGADDVIHISGFIQNDEKHHIGDFFLNAGDEDDESGEEEDEEPSVVPICLDEIPV